MFDSGTAVTSDNFFHLNTHAKRQKGQIMYIFEPYKSQSLIASRPATNPACSSYQVCNTCNDAINQSNQKDQPQPNVKLPLGIASLKHSNEARSHFVPTPHPRHQRVQDPSLFDSISNLEPREFCSGICSGACSGVCSVCVRYRLQTEVRLFLVPLFLVLFLANQSLVVNCCDVDR